MSVIIKLLSNLPEKIKKLFKKLFIEFFNYKTSEFIIEFIEEFIIKIITDGGRKIMINHNLADLAKELCSLQIFP